MYEVPSCFHILSNTFHCLSPFLTVLMALKWHLMIQISLMTNDAQHLYLPLLATFVSSLEKCLLKSFAHFLIGLLFFLLLSYKGSSSILDRSHSSNLWFANIFSHSMCYLFTFLIMLFEAQVFNIDEVQFCFVLFCLVTCALGITSKKPLLNPEPWRLDPIFSPRNFIVLFLTCKFLIHLELIFVSYVRYATNFISFACGYPVVPAPFVEKAILSSLNAPGILVESWTEAYGSFFQDSQFYFIQLCLMLC